MSDPQLTILSIFAHPDDEIGVGSTLACYAKRGVRTALICATRGEAATIFCGDCATPENLAQVRTGELECACAHLGIGELRWLDWPDGGVKALPRAAAVRQVVRLIREIRPQALLTHPENGLYPHPDHLAVWEIVRAAFSAAADDELYPDAGPAWAPARLFTRAIPQSFFERAPELKTFRVELNGAQLPFMGTPDDQIDVTMAVGDYVAQRMAAWDCHRSQHNPKGFSSTMPDGMRREMAERETFILAAARVPLPDGVHDDLLAGLTGEAPAQSGAEAADFLAALQAEAAAHSAIIKVAEFYQRGSPEADFAAELNALVERASETLYGLGRALRAAGAAPGAIAPDRELLERGRGQRSLAARRAFLRQAANAAMARLRGLAAAAGDARQRAVWLELSGAS
jgi:LmbE family N-acetylglucosaminyl deacetylase